MGTWGSYCSDGHDNVMWPPFTYNQPAIMAASIGKVLVNNCTFCGRLHSQFIQRYVSRSFAFSAKKQNISLSNDTDRDPLRGTQAEWKSVIGLEIHAQINSSSKLFSGAGTQYGSQTNSQVAFFDAALPGTLPVLNVKCVQAGVLTALALGCDINLRSSFDRKHYFYADMPAGYQITQQRKPLARNGQVTYVYQCSRTSQVERRSARLVQIQLEQDSGKSLHDAQQGVSLIDLNRAGVGLMEIVTHPDFANGDDAASFVRELRDILITIGTCDGKMAEGSLRVDANISVHKPGEPLGTRTEVKNLNSVRSIRSAIEYEIERQIQILEEGGTVENETRSFDVKDGETVQMRDKEKLLDYRFMPEPNLLPLVLYTDRASIPQARLSSPSNLIVIEDFKAMMGKLPEEKRQHLENVYNIPLIHSLTLVRNNLYELFETLVTKHSCNPNDTSLVLRNSYLSLLYGLKNDSHLCSEDSLAEIIRLYSEGNISSNVVSVLLEEKSSQPDRPAVDIVEEHRLWIVKDDALITEIIDDVLAKNFKAVKAYRKGKMNQLGILHAKVLKRLEGKADSKVVQDMIKDRLDQN